MSPIVCFNKLDIYSISISPLLRTSNWNHFSAKLMFKDLSIALKAIQNTNTPAPFGTKAQENFANMVNQKKGDLDFSAVTKFNE